MSDHEAPHIEVHENNNPDLLSQQSGMPNMSSTKTFTVDTNMRVNGDLDVTGTVTATSFIGDGSQLTGIVGGTQAAEPLSPQFPDVSPYYYIYVGEPAAKLTGGIDDLHWGSDAEHDFQYDQEFENLPDAFKFVQESNFDSVGWNSFRNSWSKTRVVFVLQNGKVYGHDDNTHSYLSLSHMKNHVIFTTQYSVDRNGTIDPTATGHSYIAYDANFSYCPHIHLGGDIGWDWIQPNSSNLIRMWVNSYVQDPYFRTIYAQRGSHVYIDGVVSEVSALENTYCKIRRIGVMPADLKTKVEALGLSSYPGNRGADADWNSTISVMDSYNHPQGISVSRGSKVTVRTISEDIVIGDGTDTGYSYNAISVRENSELFIDSTTPLTKKLVINSGTITDPTPEDNSLVTVDWGSKFSRAVSIDTTNAQGAQTLDGEILVHPDVV